MGAGRASLAALRALGWTVLTVVALAGIVLSASALYAASPLGRPVVAGAVVRILDEAVAGRLELEGIAVLPQGGVELRGVRVFDPEERLVLAVDRARIFAEVLRLRSGELGLVAELEGPSVLLDEDEDGGLSLVRAFAPARARTEPPGEDEGGGPPLAIRISRLTILDGEVWWVDREGETAVEASGIDLVARGLWSEPRAELELRLLGQAEEPVAGPIGLEVVLSREGDALSVPLLSARVGGNAVALAGEADLAARSGRAAVVRFAVDRADARALAPGAGDGADLEGAAYVESDGQVATAAVAFAPREGQAEAGRGEAAVAVALAGARALGFDVALDRVDPARLHAEAPDGEVTLTARGAVTLESSLGALRGEVDVTLAPSRLRDGRLGPATVTARADRGLLRVERLDLRAPGIAVKGAGSWREGGAVSGKVSADVANLKVALSNAGAALGERLPAASGRLRVDAVLSGTAARPRLVAHAEAPAIRAFDVAATALRLDAELTGPGDSLTGTATGTAAALSAGGLDGRGVRFTAGIAGDEVRLDLHAGIPLLGADPFTVEARGRLGPEREELVVSALALAYPGTRLSLARPATVSFAGPTVDRLELTGGEQRIALEGGLGRRGALDARLEVSGLELAGLPKGLLPPGIAGTLAVEARAEGTTSRPVVTSRVRLARGAYRGLTGLDAGGEIGWDGARRRLAVELGLTREQGGLVDVSAEVPVPLDARGQPLAVKLRAERVPVEDLLALAEIDDATAQGLIALDVALDGTTRAPRLEATLGITEGAYDDFFPIAARVRLADAGDRLEVAVEADLDGRRAIVAEAGWPLELAAVLDDPAAAIEALWAAPMRASARVPGVDLATLAGTLGLPADLVGILTAEASLEGTVRAPRGMARAALAGGALAGYRGVGGEVEVTLAPAAVKLAGVVAVGGAELARFHGSLAATPEALLEPARLRAAPLALDVIVPEGRLARAAGEAVPLAGTLHGSLGARGSLGAPVVELALSGTGVEVGGRALGDATATARYAAGKTTAAVEVRGAAGGTARASGALDARFGLGADPGPLADRPVELRLVADAFGLGVLPALAPGVVRTASGRLDADVAATGRLGRPSPRGTLRIADGRVAVSEYGDWTGITIDAEVTDDAVEVRRVEARRGSGSVTASGALRGLAAGKAKLEGKLRSEGLTVIRGGMPLATFDLEANATGSYAADRLEVQLRIPRGVVRLPDKLPRELQTVERRADILVGKPKEPRRRPGAAEVVAAGVEAGPPFTLVVHAIAKDQLFVRSENPRIDLELKADVRYELRGAESYAEGSVEVIRGYVEPIGGRTFHVERGRVQFTGGPPKAALLDVEARYENPVAEVTVTVGGPALDPEIRLSSQPPMDDAQIAMLIATGRTELKPGGGGVGTITGEEAGRAALSVLATRVFKDLVADKLPLDTVALDSSALRAGKYVTDKIYVGYTRRFDADVERGENSDEVRVEYQVSPRWTFESRYGNAQSGGASLVWSKDY